MGELSIREVRPLVTVHLTKAAIGYFIKKGYGVNTELGVMPWGKRKVDVIGISMKGHVVIAEVKSCPSDFLTDKKWHEYIPFSNKMYFIMLPETWEALAEHKERLVEKGVGVLILCEKTGYLRSVLKAKERKMEGKIKKNIVLRLAWRGAAFSKRNTRRMRVFLK